MENNDTIFSPSSFTMTEDVRKRKNTFTEHSNEIDDIISKRPPFFVRWGIPIFLALLLLLITATWFIKYPEIIQGSAVLTGDNAPKEIVPKQSGRLTALFVKNNQQVKQGDIIGWLESNAATQAVIK